MLCGEEMISKNWVGLMRGITEAEKGGDVGKRKDQAEV